MIKFKQIENLTLDDLYKELGFADFTYIELNEFLEQLEKYRSQLHQKIKEKQYDQSLDNGK